MSREDVGQVVIILGMAKEAGVLRRWRKGRRKKGLHGAHTQLCCNGAQPLKGTKDHLQGLA